MKQRKITSAAETPGQEQFFNETLFQLVESVQLRTVPKPGVPHTTTSGTRTPSQIYLWKKKKGNLRAQAVPHPERAATWEAPRKKWREWKVQAPVLQGCKLPLSARYHKRSAAAQIKPPPPLQRHQFPPGKPALTLCSIYLPSHHAAS